jgi:O-antigen/teichoic acid export membrane protein
VLAQLGHAALQAEERYWAHFALSAFGSVTRSFLPLALVALSGATLAVLGSGFLAHAALWALAAGWLLRPAWHRPTALAPATDSPAAFVQIFMGVGACGWIAATAPRWIAAEVLTPAHTGFFILAGNLSMIVPAAVTLIGQSYSFPPLFAAARAGALRNKLEAMNTRTVLAAMVIGQLGVLTLAWAGPQLIGTIIHPRYAPATDWLLATGGATLATVSSSFYCNLLVAGERQRCCLPLMLASALFRIALPVAAAMTGGERAFQLTLAFLAWPTALLEHGLAHVFLRQKR